MLKKVLSLIFVFVAIMFAFCGVSNAVDPVNQVYPHWEKSPITVFIPENSKSASMRNAFNRWQGVSYGKIRFSYTDNEEKADIKVKFSDVSADYQGSLGSSSVQKSGNEITGATISINVGSKEYSNNYVYTVMLQEVGHALGLPNNPRKPSSIMHTPVSENQDIMKIDVRELFRINGWSYGHKNMLE